MDDTSVPDALLADLQEAVSAHDLPAVLDLFTGDAVLFGTSAANLDRAAIERYVDLVLKQDGTLRWHWEEVHVVDSRPGALTFVALGTVGLVGGADERRDPIRLTCLAVEDGERWRLRHFHGSLPDA